MSDIPSQVTLSAWGGRRMNRDAMPIAIVIRQAAKRSAAATLIGVPTGAVEMSRIPTYK
ncbi:hypothetical protein [Rhizobium sp. No.120]